MPKPTLLLLSLTSSLLTVALAGAALAGPAYRWTTADGSIAFSDDLKKIPSQYRASAERVGTRNLADYPRYTPAERAPARNDRTAAMVERIQRLRDLAAQARHRHEPANSRPKPRCASTTGPPSPSRTAPRPTMSRS
jgi:hypothetical protein